MKFLDISFVTTKIVTKPTNDGNFLIKALFLLNVWFWAEVTRFFEQTGMLRMATGVIWSIDRFIS